MQGYEPSPRVCIPCYSAIRFMDPVIKDIKKRGMNSALVNATNF